MITGCTLTWRVSDGSVINIEEERVPIPRKKVETMHKRLNNNNINGIQILKLHHNLIL
jgi:hypothetical protein